MLKATLEMNGESTVVLCRTGWWRCAHNHCWQ